MLQDLIQNTAILVALVVLFDLARVQSKLENLVPQTLAGIALGVSGILVMLTPWEFTPGLFFDTRSIVLGIGGLFLGAVPTAIGMIMTAGLRFIQGGVGTWPGIGLIVTSGVIGVAYRYHYRENLESIPNYHLYIFGILIHIPMLLWMLALPWEHARTIIPTIWFPIMLIFPAGTLLIGILIKNRMLVNRNQDELANSNLFNQALLNASPDIIYIYDIVENLNVYSSTSIGEVLGYTSAETREFGESILPALMHPSDLQRYVETILPRYQIAQNNEVIEHDYRMKNRAGKYIRLLSKELIFKRQADGSPQQIFGITSDITETFETNQDLKHSEKKLSNLLDGLDAGILVHAPDTSITFSNSRAAELLGHESPKSLEGIKASDERWHFVNEDLSKIQILAYPVNRILASRGPIKNVMLGVKRTVTPDITWLLVNGFPVTSENAEIKEVVISFIDFTERMAIQNSLQQGQKLQALGTMIGGISHELNNALQSIFLYGDLLKEDLGSRATPESNIDALMDSAFRARDLVNQILSFGRMNNSNFQEYSIAPIVDDAMKLIRASMPTDIKIETEVELECGPVLCDKTQVHQIIINLCNNARDAMGSQPGILGVCLKEIQTDLNQQGTPQAVAELTVSDTGSGIKYEHINQVFDPFFTTKEVGEGTGLGLSVVQNLVVKMNGLITVTSTPGAGTQFRVLLPILQTTARAEKLLDNNTSQTRVGSSFLLVDDEPSILNASKQMLILKGFIIDTASSGQEALNLTRRSPGKYDAIITDLSMPGMTGAELAREIRTEGLTVPIIISSGHLGVTENEELMAAGASALIQKPWSLAELMAVLDDLVDAD